MSTEESHRKRTQLFQCFYFVEIPLFASAGILAYILHSTMVFKTSPVMYSPDDVSLMKPFTPTGNRTIPASPVSILMVLTIPCALIAFMEFILMVSTICCMKPAPPPIGTSECFVGRTSRRLVRLVGIHIFGFFVTSAVCDILRKQVASLSPHFLSVCKPQHHESRGKLRNELNNDEDPESLRLENRYFSDDCTPLLGTEILHAARLQSPSYLISLMSFSAVYTLFYLRATFQGIGPMLNSLFLCSTLIFPYVTGLLEVAEYTSHLSSIIYGWILGSSIAFLLKHTIFPPNFTRICKCPKVCKKKTKDKNSNRAANVFEYSTTPKFSLRGYDVANDDIASDTSNYHDETHSRRSLNHETEAQNTAPPTSPSADNRTPRPQTSSDQVDERRSGHTFERNVIKELKTYISDSDATESPKPTQIRELSRGAVQDRRQAFSTFQANPETEENNEGLHIQIYSRTDEQQKCENDGENSRKKSDDSHSVKRLKTDSSAFTFVSSFQKAPPLDGRPFSYHGRNASESSDESLPSDLKHLVSGSKVRPTSFSHPQKSAQDSASREPPESILSYFSDHINKDLFGASEYPFDKSDSNTDCQTNQSQSEENTCCEAACSSRQSDSQQAIGEEGIDEKLSSSHSDGTIAHQPSIVV